MSNKFYTLLMSVLSALFLAACAERIIPDLEPDSQLRGNDRPIDTQQTELSQDTESPPFSGTKTALLEMLSCLDRVESQALSVIANELKQVKADLQISSGLDHQTNRDHLRQKFFFACLLSRDPANDAQLARAHALLEALLRDELLLEERQLVQLLAHKISLQMQLRQHQHQLSVLRAHNQELLEKIEQLKGLERDLDVTNLPIPEPAL